MTGNNWLDIFAIFLMFSAAVMAAAFVYLMFSRFGYHKPQDKSRLYDRFGLPLVECDVPMSKVKPAKPDLTSKHDFLHSPYPEYFCTTHSVVIAKLQKKGYPCKSCWCHVHPDNPWPKTNKDEISNVAI